MAARTKAKRLPTKAAGRAAAIEPEESFDSVVQFIDAAGQRADRAGNTALTGL